MKDLWEMYESGGQEATSQPRACDAPGCSDAGEHRAPKSRDGVQDYYWFCLDHAREYNQRWDYFDGMSRAEIETFMREAETGHRPTWKTAERHVPGTEDLADAVQNLFGGKRSKPSSPPRGQIDPELHKSLAVLDMDYPVTLTELKLQYKKLVKKHHPDAARSSKHSEETFKHITQAYQQATKLLRRQEENDS